MPFDSDDDEPPSFMDMVQASKPKQRPIRVLNDGSIVAAELEDGSSGLNDDAYNRGNSPLSLIEVEDENGNTKMKIRKVTKKKKKKVRESQEVAD